MLNIKPPTKSKQVSYSDYVRDFIRSSILNGDVKSGDRIRESDLLKLLSVSRTPIREAMKSLEAEGLITLEAWKGAVITELSRRQIIELYDMRILLEGQAARLAAEMITTSEIEKLEELQELSENKTDNNQNILSGLNSQFHQAICKASHNRFTNEILEPMRTSMALMRGNAYGEKGSWVKVLAEHRAILDAVKAGDGPLAQSLMVNHIRASASARLAGLTDIDI